MSDWVETYGETVKAIADELIDPQDPVSEPSAMANIHVNSHALVYLIS